MQTIHIRSKNTAQKNDIKEFFSKCDQTHSFLWIRSHLLNETLMDNFIFSAMPVTFYHSL